ncbi:MAG: hypothetical protein WEC84_00365 [Candidatus Andersenbacteria bacterium]
MNQKGFIAPLVIVVVAVVAIGAGIYFTRQGQEGEESAVSTESNQSTEQTTESEGSSLSGTVTDLLQSGQNLTCTFNRTDEAGTTSGTVYVAGQGQRFRGDFTLSQADGMQMDAHVVQEGDVNYFWSDQLPQGTKTTVTDEEAATPSDTANPQAVLDENVDYSCRPWIVDNSMFNLPSDKEFVDITQQVQQLNVTTEEVQQSQCAACNQLQGPAKDQCLQALSC